MPLDELKKARLEKLNKIIKTGTDPYPAKSNRTHTIADTIAGFETLSSLSSEITLAGRVMIVRGQGAILFVELLVGTLLALFGSSLAVSRARKK